MLAWPWKAPWAHAGAQMAWPKASPRTGCFEILKMVSFLWVLTSTQFQVASGYGQMSTERVLRKESAWELIHVC